MSKDNLGIVSPTTPETSDEILAVLRGDDLVSYRLAKIENRKITEHSRRHLLSPPSSWPNLIFNWDLSSKGWRFTLDGCTTQDFEKQYPGGLRLGWVNLLEFDEHLDKFNHRELKELWSIGDKDKLAKAIEYVHQGKKISPPLISYLSEKNKIILIGGNHRYTVAKFSNQIDLPIYTEPEKTKAISEIINIRWA